MIILVLLLHLCQSTKPFKLYVCVWKRIALSRTELN